MWRIQCDKCNVMNSLYQNQCDECVLLNAMWWMHCIKYNGVHYDECNVMKLM